MANWQNLSQSGQQLSPQIVTQLQALDTAATQVTVAAGVPSGAPANGSPIYLNSSASNNLYIWTGAAWRGPYNVGS